MLTLYWVSVLGKLETKDALFGKIEYDRAVRPEKANGVLSEGQSNKLKWACVLRNLGTVMKYKVALYRSEEGISICVPALPGCWSEGDTEEEALENIQDAIREYLVALEERLEDAEVREVEMQG